MPDADAHTLPFIKNARTSCVHIAASTHSHFISSKSQTGFTLVEIVVVVVILSIFAGMMSLSVGSSEARKNRAFYEHLTDSLSYVRLLSAERMQPMGLSLQADKRGQVTPVIVTLSNPYAAYQTASVSADSNDSTPKNAMELSAELSTMSGGSDEALPTPSWETETEVTLPELPSGVHIRVQSLAAVEVSSAQQAQTLQPWFVGQMVPQVVWFGTGQATPVTIEVLHEARLVGDVITIMPDGSMMIGQGQ
ncbi:MAG: prepilin-type N-terminal cleavage/methylation domain-containing protein [Psychrobacter celer]